MVVYLITNKINGKQYVGQTVKQLNLRWNEHTASKSNSALHRAIRKYGKEKFSIISIHECISKEEMDFVEIFYISFLNTKAHNGYNLTSGGEGRSGYKLSESAKKSISEKNKGHVMSLEQKLQISKRHKGTKLPPRSEETRRKISLARVGMKFSEETKAKISAAKLGKKLPAHTKETKLLMSLARRRRPLVPEIYQPKGIFWRENRNKWESRIRFNGKPKYLGRYVDRETATLVWDRAFLCMFGEAKEKLRKEKRDAA